MDLCVENLIGKRNNRILKAKGFLAEAVTCLGLSMVSGPSLLDDSEADLPWMEHQH